VAEPADLSIVEVLARLQLAARRMGWSFTLHGVSAELVELLELAGLAELFVEVGGEPEGGEEVRVEEVVVPDDAAL
jgi:anti-anti-sigma regulatory factor